MAKRIVILNGSPRKNGNTSALVKAFTEGAKNAGHAVTEFFLGGMEIHGCKGCFGGHSGRECPCVQRDDMDKIYPAVRDSDVVVLATPLYYWNMSGQLRTAIDRLFALEEGDGNLLRGNGRASALLMAAEGHGFEDVSLYYDHLSEHLRWKNLGKVLCGGVMDAGDIQGQDAVDFPGPAVRQHPVELVPLPGVKTAQALISVNVHQLPVRVFPDVAGVVVYLGQIGVELVCGVTADTGIGGYTKFGFFWDDRIDHSDPWGFDLVFHGELCAALLYRDQMKPCAICGSSFVPKSNRAKYCPGCALHMKRKKATERKRKQRLNCHALEVGNPL